MLLLAFASTLRAEILAPLANPNFDLLLLFAGVLLIYIEFHRPGIVLPGVLGTLLTLTAIYGFNQLPLRPFALLLVLTSFTLIVLELKFPSYGAFTTAGIVALILGTLTLIDSPSPALRIQPTIAIAVCVCFGGLTALLLRLAVRARRQKVLTGPAALVGSSATTLEPISIANAHPRGHILVQGEIWEATASAPIAEKVPVLVTGHQGLILHVEARAD